MKVYVAYRFDGWNLLFFGVYFRKSTLFKHHDKFDFYTDVDIHF